MKKGISILPPGNSPYREGYRYGAYTVDDNEEMHIVEFFKTTDEIQKFVNENPEFGKQK